MGRVTAMAKGIGRLAAELKKGGVSKTVVEQVRELPNPRRGK